MRAFEGIRVLDATWFLPNSPFCGPEGTTPLDVSTQARLHL